MFAEIMGANGYTIVFYKNGVKYMYFLLSKAKTSCWQGVKKLFFDQVKVVKWITLDSKSS